MATLAAPRLDPRFVAHDPRFLDVVGVAPRLGAIAEADAHEGPVYVAAEHALYFTTVRRSRAPVAIKRLALDDGTVTIVRPDAGNANGMALGADGRLLVCEQGSFDRPARIASVDPASGEAETVVDAWRGLPLNSPNDVVVSRDGAVWFTDPSYGHLQGFRPDPLVADVVYRLEPQSGRLDAVAAGFDKPNGLAFSPDERVLYVSDNGAPHALLAFDVVDDRCLGARRRVAVGSPEHPDGVKVDAAGRIYVSAATGVHVLDPSGDLLGEIGLPGAVNFCFGGRDGTTLFVTADTAIWAAELAAKGA